jgi:beta-1,4-mannosyl-glycoprotein beta-1,4-N-acetylglucosaminyltransferase
MELFGKNNALTICLNMIVKDESHIIADTLNKLCNKIKFSYWVICDTGSTDNTPEIIKKFFKEKNIPGELFYDEWVNFAHNRTIALNRGFKKTDLLMVFDADDELIGNLNLNIFSKENLMDEYQLQFGSAYGVNYTRTLIINNHKKFEYKSVIHEFISFMEGNSRVGIIEGDYYVVSGRSGNRNKDPDKYLKDAQVLEKAYDVALKEKDDLFHRYAFYCANSYKDYGDNENAIKWYKIVLSHDKQWPQEKYMACLNIYICYNNLKEYEPGFFFLIQSFFYDKERVECLFYLVQHYCVNNMHEISYSFYLICKNFYENNYLKSQQQIKLFVEPDKYDFLLPFYMILVADKLKEQEPAANKTISKMFEIIFTKKYKVNNDNMLSNLLYNVQFFIDNAIKDVDNFINLFQSYINFLENVINVNFNESKYHFLEKYEKYGIVYKYRKKMEIQQFNFTKNDCLNSNKILIYAGFSNVLWNQTYSNNNSLGGSETAICNLVKYLPNNYEIYVGGTVEEETNDNVHFVNLGNLKKLIKETAFHTLIVSRYTGFYEMFPETSFYQSFIWAHDVAINSYGSNKDVNDILNIWNDRINGCICLTEWHKNLFQSQYLKLKDKIHIINNGILTEKFNSNVKKMENRFVYSSCSERGLDRLLELWPKIITELPNAELYICSYNKFPQNDLEYKLNEIIKQFDSIKHVGSLNRTELYNLMCSSDYWLYPTCWHETSCITAMEMLMAEVICVYYPIGGLVDTLGDYGIAVERDNEIETIINLTSKKKNEIRKRGKEYALTCSWENRAKVWSNILCIDKANSTQISSQNSTSINDESASGKKTWIFYHYRFYIQPIIDYISNFATSDFNVYITNNINDVIKLKPHKITILLFTYIELDFKCLTDEEEEIFSKMKKENNIEFSFLQLEPLNIPHRLLGVIETLNRNPKYSSYKIYDYSKSNIRIMNQHGITNCEHLPYNVTDVEKNKLTNLYKETEKIYDFGFINRTTTMPITPPRRNKILEYLIKNGFSVLLISGWGEDRDTELAKCKIILNIHGQISENPNPVPEECSNIFEHIRCDRLLESGFQILSEESLYLDDSFINKYPNLKIIKYSNFFELETYNQLHALNYKKNTISNDKKIIDCFTFYNEMDILNYRLNILDDVVDYFILVEANQTHSGKQKQLHFNENKHKFEKFKDKIIHVVVDLPLSYQEIDTSKGQQWVNEKSQRSSISHGFNKIDINDKDLIIISDVDEIPDPNALLTIKKYEHDIELLNLEQDFYYYNLNCKKIEKWYFSRILTYKKFKEFNCNCDDIRFRRDCFTFSKAGWHLSYFGSPDFIINKLENFAHQEYNNDNIKNLDNIKNSINGGRDLFNRESENATCGIVKIDVKDNNYLPPRYDEFLTNFYELKTDIKKYCFIHSCNLPGVGTSKLDHIIKLINSSGLINKLDTVFVNNIGMPIDDDYLNKFDNKNKYEIVNYSGNILLFENPTINRMIEFSKRNSGSYILYLHTKGISYDNNNQQINDWVDMMLYYLVEKHEVCFRNLENNNDVVGCNFLEQVDNNVPKHFSGNFWWGKSDYLKNLMLLDETKPSKTECEMILFKNNPKFYEMHNSGVNHYHECYSRSKYAL